MNNKGQVLIIFVIMLPILVTVLSFVVDLGLLSIEKRKLNNNTYDAVVYYLNNINNIDIKEKTTKLLEKNLNDVYIKIIENDIDVKITVEKEYKSLYTVISNNQKISITYKGIKENNEIIKG